MPLVGAFFRLSLLQSSSLLTGYAMLDTDEIDPIGGVSIRR